MPANIVEDKKPIRLSGTGRKGGRGEGEERGRGITGR
jgi:hypothetical protein